MSFRNDKLSLQLSLSFAPSLPPYRWRILSVGSRYFLQMQIEGKMWSFFIRPLPLSPPLSFRAWSTFIFSRFTLPYQRRLYNTATALPFRLKTFSPFHTYRLLIMMLISKSMEHQEHFEIISTIFMRPFR